MTRITFAIVVLLALAAPAVAAGVNRLLLADMEREEATRAACLRHRAVADRYAVCRQYVHPHRR